ncbi:MAG: hypothetical protein RR255_00520 [Bacilli bacterium]
MGNMNGEIIEHFNDGNVDKIIESFNKRLKEIHIKGLAQGGEVSHQVIIDMINNGTFKTVEDIKNWCKTSIKAKNIIEEVSNK